jgi:hypothetical protein
MPASICQKSVTSIQEPKKQFERESVLDVDIVGSEHHQDRKHIVGTVSDALSAQDMATAETYKRRNEVSTACCIISHAMDRYREQELVLISSLSDECVLEVLAVIINGNELLLDLCQITYVSS